MPKAVAMAVNTVMVIRRILPQMVLFSFSMVIVFFISTQRHGGAENQLFGES